MTVTHSIRNKNMVSPIPSRRTFLADSALIAGSAFFLENTGVSAMASPLENQEARKKLLQQCLGGPWPEGTPLDAKVEKTEQKDGYQLIRVNYLVEPTERIAAWLLIPDKVDAKNKAPGICLWHQHAGQYDVGKDEPAGVRSPNFAKMHMTGVALAKEGYVVLCPDAAGFGERNSRIIPGTKKVLKGGELERFLFGKYVTEGKSLAWKNILDMKRAVDYITSRPEVVAQKLGCYGHSMGSTHTWQIGPWEPRLKALVGNCCMPTYQAMERTNLLHCFPNYVPGWKVHGDIPDIVSLIAPKPLHLNFGETDDGSPIEEVKAAMPLIKKAYETMNAGDNFSWFIEEKTGHVLSDEMWKRTKAHFAKHLNS